MEINYGFYLDGFERQNFYNDGMAFYRYEKQPSAGKSATATEVIEHGLATEIRLKFRPTERRVKGSVLITRPSKNRYNVSMMNGKAVLYFQAQTLGEIEKQVKDFFREEEHGKTQCVSV